MHVSIKRTMDVAMSVLLLAAASPVLGAAMLAVRLNMGAPVLFRQRRPGLGGRPFTLLKLRTMTTERGADGGLLPPEQRITRLGRVLRATSVDELPQLWNVLRGDMSLVGPRPLRMEYLERYSREQARRHEVLPGVTGWAQVNGRNALGWEDRFRLDVWYVDHQTLRLDCKILALTLWRVVSRRGLNHPNDAISAPFRGTPSRSGEH